MEQTANALPPVTLGQYKGLPVTRRVRPVTEAAVASELKSLARRHAPFCATSAPAARGMRVTLDFEGFLDGAPIPDSRMEQVTVTLGTAQLMPAAEQAVYGHCAGETFRFDFTYPDEFRVPELSGKTAQFEICLHTVEQKQEPTVDDALAQRLGFATLDALRESICAKKAASHEANADRLAEAALLDLAGANLTVELPAAVLDQNADHALQQLKDKLSRSRISLELYCQANNTTPEQLRAGYRQDAARRMRAMLAVPAIAQAENDKDMRQWEPLNSMLLISSTLAFARYDDKRMWAYDVIENAMTRNLGYSFSEEYDESAEDNEDTNEVGGQPGLRPNYGPTYYAAFVHDPEGNNIEAMLA